MIGNLPGSSVRAKLVSGRDRWQISLAMQPERPIQNDPAPISGDDRSPGADIDDPARWPLPVRAAIALGGGAALWGLILLALR